MGNIVGGGKTVFDAASKGNLRDVKKRLDAGENANAVDKSRRSLLHHSAGHGHTNITALLLERGANPNARTKSGNTPVHSAAYFGHLQDLQYLIAFGGSVKLKNKEGKTAMARAHGNGKKAIASFLSDIDKGKITAFKVAEELKIDRTKIMKALKPTARSTPPPSPRPNKERSVQPAEVPPTPSKQQKKKQKEEKQRQKQKKDKLTPTNNENRTNENKKSLAVDNIPTITLHGHTSNTTNSNNHSAMPSKQRTSMVPKTTTTTTTTTATTAAPSTSNTTVSSDEPVDIFISLRFSEAITGAEALRDKLEKKGLNVFLCAVQAGGDIMDQIVKNIDACKLVVIMGTTTYGQETDAPFSTCEELKFIMNEKKEMFLVKMCERFETPLARFHLGGNVAYYMWTPKTSSKQKNVPSELVDAIVTKFSSIS
eukprot:m.63623 g.63623  ORF g.63623 m.63623 type:complete len:426 (+) comp11450_c0_seq1:72-1349(+)